MPLCSHSQLASLTLQAGGVSHDSQPRIYKLQCHEVTYHRRSMQCNICNILMANQVTTVKLVCFCQNLPTENINNRMAALLEAPIHFFPN